MLGFFATALGLSVGSFLNVVIHRLPRMMEQAWRLEAKAILSEANDSGPTDHPTQALTPPADEAAAPAYNLAWPGSHCPHCHKPIRWRHNIPVLSWLWLRGRCADCSASIALRYPLIELAGGLIAALCYTLFAPDWLSALGYSIFLWSLLALALIDMETGYLPDEITLSVLWLGLLFNLYTGTLPLTDAVLGAALGYGSLWLLATGYRLVRGVHGMGGGDLKMLAMIGAWFGWQPLSTGVLLACILMLLYALIRHLSGRNARVLRFGPGLAATGLWAFYNHFGTVPAVLKHIIPYSTSF